MARTAGHTLGGAGLPSAAVSPPGKVGWKVTPPPPMEEDPFYFSEVTKIHSSNTKVLIDPGLLYPLKARNEQKQTFNEQQGPPEGREHVRCSAWGKTCLRQSWGDWHAGYDRQ